MKSPSGYAIIIICGTINELYSRHFISCGNRSFNLFKTPVIFEHLFEILSECFSHFKLVSTVMIFVGINLFL